MDKNDVNVRFSMSDDRTVMVLMLTAKESIDNRALYEILEDHAHVLRKVELARSVDSAGT